MAKKTTLNDEIEERVDYFTDWLDRLSNDTDKSRVVNERTAREFIQSTYEKDSNLSNLLEGMENSPQGFNVLIKSRYIQNLIYANTTGEKLEKATESLRMRRQSLEQLIPKKNVEQRREVVNRFTTAATLKKYNISKDNRGRYHDTRTGRYVGFDKILKVTDTVIISSSQKRKELEDYIAKIKK